MIRAFCLIICLSLLPAVAGAQSATVERMAREILTQLQAKSFEQRREFCGWIGIDKAGKLVRGKTYRGRRSTCRSGLGIEGARPIASYHTHGHYAPRFDNEVPSTIDLATEVSGKTYGYVATPMGRFWLVDGKRKQVRLICGPGCLPSQKGAKEGKFGKIRKTYTEKQLYARQGGKPFKVNLCNGMLCKAGPTGIMPQRGADPF